MRWEKGEGEEWQEVAEKILREEEDAGLDEGNGASEKKWKGRKKEERERGIGSL